MPLGIAEGPPMKKKPKQLNNGRDYLILAIIKGATKSGTQKDKKKEQNKKLARKKVKPDET